MGEVGSLLTLHCREAEVHRRSNSSMGQVLTYSRHAFSETSITACSFKFAV